jgi:hypothetical protein
MTVFYGNRKGVVTYVLGFPEGPSVIAAYIRASWSLGQVQQRYIFEGDGADQLPAAVAKHISENFSIQGVTPIAQSHFEQLGRDLSRELIAEVREYRSQPSVSTENSSNREGERGINDDSRFDWFLWGEMYHVVPQDFTLKSMSVKQIWSTGTLVIV